MYLYASPVYFDELDANGVLDNARYALHVEHAQSALFESFGQGWTSRGERDPDLRYAVRALNIEFLGPVTSPGVMDIRLYLNSFGRTSATFGFRCEWRGAPCALGTRTIVKVDHANEAIPWSGRHRAALADMESQSSRFRSLI
jgi:acyl-CoA thioester hydrolase